jgi:hypothetical protein
MNSKGKDLLDLVIQEYFNNNFELPQDSKITLSRLINYCYTLAEEDIYMFWLSLGGHFCKFLFFSIIYDREK